jgi:hypothetical protein
MYPAASSLHAAESSRENYGGDARRGGLKPRQQSKRDPPESGNAARALACSFRSLSGRGMARASESSLAPPLIQALTRSESGLKIENKKLTGLCIGTHECAPRMGRLQFSPFPGLQRHELCGLRKMSGHVRRRSPTHLITPRDFDNWCAIPLARRSSLTISRNPTTRC